jgi:hypothetical protein
MIPMSTVAMVLGVMVYFAVAFAIALGIDWLMRRNRSRPVNPPEGFVEELASGEKVNR